MTCAYDWAVSAAAARTTKASLPKSGAQPGTKDIDREARESRGPAPRILAAAAAPPCDDDQAPDRTADTRAVLASCQTPQFDPTRPRQCAHRASPRGAVSKPLSACSLSQARWCIRGRRNGAHVHPRDRPRGQTGLRGAEHATRLEGGLSRLRLDRVDPVERQSWSGRGASSPRFGDVTLASSATRQICQDRFSTIASPA